MIKRHVLGIVAAATTAFAGTASAEVLGFFLNSHPDGNVSPPQYGLRLDGLYTGNSNDEWTFDFDGAGADMRMWIDTDASTVTISGTAYGGRDTGSGYDPTLQGLWDINFVYEANVSINQVSGDLEVVVDPESVLNVGTLTAQFNASNGGVNIVSGASINLEQEMEFFFNNTDDHRLDCGVACAGLEGPDTYVGWGWLNHSDSDHIEASDWLFTATAVPLPAAGWMFLSGLGLLGWRRARS